MGDLFVGQPFKLRVGTKWDLSSATDLKLKYEKPGGQTGEWACTRSGSTLVVSITNQIDQAGIWKFQSCVTDSEGTRLGKIVIRRFLNPL